MIKLILPLPCAINRMYRAIPFFAHGGKARYCRQVLSREARIRRDALVAEIWKQLGGRPEPITGQVQVQYLIVPASKRTPDVDAYEKHLLDSLTHAGIWRDDRQVVAVHKERAQTPAMPGRVEVEIWELES